MAKMNWQKVNDQKAVDYARRNNDCFKGVNRKSYKITKITNSQKKYIAALLRGASMKWDNSINNLSLKEASQLIDFLKTLQKK